MYVRRSFSGYLNKKKKMAKSVYSVYKDILFLNTIRHIIYIFIKSDSWIILNYLYFSVRHNIFTLPCYYRKPFYLLTKVLAKSSKFLAHSSTLLLIGPQFLELSIVLMWMLLSSRLAWISSKPPSTNTSRASLCNSTGNSSAAHISSTLKYNTKY